METNIVALEDAIIELGKVQSFLRLVDVKLTAEPTVKDAQNAYLIFNELFTEKYNELKKVFYGEDTEND